MPKANPGSGSEIPLGDALNTKAAGSFSMGLRVASCPSRECNGFPSLQLALLMLPASCSQQPTRLRPCKVAFEFENLKNCARFVQNKEGWLESMGLAQTCSYLICWRIAAEDQVEFIDHPWASRFQMDIA